jgi:hypothetical protein
MNVNLLPLEKFLTQRIETKFCAKKELIGEFAQLQVNTRERGAALPFPGRIFPLFWEIIWNFWVKYFHFWVSSAGVRIRE